MDVGLWAHLDLVDPLSPLQPTKPLFFFFFFGPNGLLYSCCLKMNQLFVLSIHGDLVENSHCGYQ